MATGVDVFRAVVIVAGAYAVGRGVRHGFWPRRGERWTGDRPWSTRLMWASYAVLASEAVVTHLIRLGHQQIAPYLWVNAVAFGLILAARRTQPRRRLSDTQ